MNKTNQDLKSSKHSRSSNNRQLAVPLSPEETLKTSDLEMEEEMIGMYFYIDSLLSNTEKKVIQFIGVKEGEGTTTIIKAFAKVVSEKFEKSVRLLDMDKQKPGQFIYYDINSENSTKEPYSNDKARDPVSVPHKFVKPLLNTVTPPNQKSELIRRDEFWENMSQKFDFILVDSPSVAVSSVGLAISRKMDGVILVLEAEKTRWEMVESVRDKIIKHGGKILGVILNKRKYYIPEFLYKNI